MTTQSIVSRSAPCATLRDDEDDKSAVCKLFGRPRSSNKSIIFSDISVLEDKSFESQALTKVNDVFEERTRTSERTM